MTEKYYGWWLPIDVSTHGHQIDYLIVLIHVFMAILFLGWIIYFVYTIVRFRKREGRKAVYHVTHFKAPTYIEIAVAIGEFFLLAALSMPLLYHLKQQTLDKDNTFHVRVVAQQFAWNIHYPGQDGVFGKTEPKLMSSSNPVGLDISDPAAKDDIVAINQLHVPVNTPVVARLSSKDVIHGFALPVMRIKQDVIPGQAISVGFEAKETGDFEIACAQLCGLGHYRMRGFFIVQTKEDLEKWLAEQPKGI